MPSDDFEENFGAGSDRRVKRPGMPVDPRRLLRVALGRWRAVGVAALLGAALGVALLLALPRVYVSSATLVYDGVPLLDTQGFKDPSALIESATFADNLRQVRAQLQLPLSLQELRERVSMSTGADLRSVVVEAKASSAESARTLGQVMIDVFMSRQTEITQKRIDSALNEVQSSLEAAAIRLDAARASYAEFQERTGESDPVLERAELLERTAKFKIAADEQQVEATAQQARVEELTKAKNDHPARMVTSAKRGTPVDAALAQARAKLAKARATLSEEHPRVLALRQQVANLEAQRRSQTTELSEEVTGPNPTRLSVDKDLAIAKVSLAAAQERRASLLVLAQRAEAAADKLTSLESEARRLQADLRAAEVYASGLREKFSVLKDASRNPSSGFRIISPPSLPERPAHSLLKLALLSSVPLLFGLLVVLFSIGRELRGLRLRTAREVAWWGNGPVLGTSCWPRHTRALDDFVDEMEDVGMVGIGRTLVVPATESERDVACRFAMRLAEAPWLAAAILDVNVRSAEATPIIVPASVIERNPALSADVTQASRRDPTPRQRPARLPSDTPIRPAKPTIEGWAPPEPSRPPPARKVTPANPTMQGVSSRPPRKRTLVGIPPSSYPPPPAGEPEPVLPPSRWPRTRVSTPPFGSQIPSPQVVSQASVRMVVPDSHPRRSHREAALTRPVILTGEGSDAEGSMPVSPSVMHAAMTVLREERIGLADPMSAVERAKNPAVALAWNGPLQGAVLRRAARLSDRVIVVVSSGMPAIDLSNVTTRLGRDQGVGYVLVNLADEYADLQDRVGEVEAFWHGSPPGQYGTRVT